MVRFTGLAIAALVTLIGCSAAPESTGQNDDALRSFGGGLGGGGVVVNGDTCGYSGETYWYGYVNEPMTICSGISIQSGHTLSTSVPFEAQLLALGCTQHGYYLSGKYSLTSCPDTCAVKQLAFNYKSVDPIYAQVTHNAPGSCWGTAPSGQIWFVWDPNCPSSCLVMSAG